MSGAAMKCSRSAPSARTTAPRSKRGFSSAIRFDARGIMPASACAPARPSARRRWIRFPVGASKRCATWRVSSRRSSTRVGAVYVREKLESAAPHSHSAAAGTPESIIIVGGGAAGNAAAETLRREGYSGRLTMLSADESMPCDRPNLSKGYLAGAASDESNLLRPAKFYQRPRN